MFLESLNKALFYFLQGGESMITERKGGWENANATGGAS